MLTICYILPNPDDSSVSPPNWRDVGARIRCVALAQEMAALGAKVRIRLWRNLDASRADGSLYDADVYVILQNLLDQRGLVRELVDAGRCVVTDICDDVTQYNDLYALTWPNVERAAAVTVPTRSLADRLAPRIAAPISVVADAVEGPRRPIRPPRPDGPLRLLWYGWQHKISALVDRLDDLRDFARTTRPIVLTVMTDLYQIFPATREVIAAADERFSVVMLPWSLGSFDIAIEDTDITIIPFTEGVAFSGRSPVRLIQSAWQGRTPIAEDVDSFGDYAGFGMVHERLIDGVRRVAADPEAAARQVEAAQRVIEEKHGPKVLARRWLDILTEAHARFHAGRGGSSAKATLERQVEGS